MTDDRDNHRSAVEADVEREIRQTRKFTRAEAIARIAGPGEMKGGSPVSRVQQAQTNMGIWLRSHAPDAAGALTVLLPRHLKGSGLLLDNLDNPLAALAAYCEQVLASNSLLKELVREADVEWGRQMDEQPALRASRVAAAPRRSLYLELRSHRAERHPQATDRCCTMTGRAVTGP